MTDITIVCVILAITFICFMMVMYSLVYIDKINKQKINEETTNEPCSIKYASGVWGEECKQYILNKLKELESK